MNALLALALGASMAVASQVQVVEKSDRHGAIFAGYMDHDALEERMRRLATAHPESCELVRFGRSYEGRDLHALVIGRGDPGPALLLTAGFDGLHLVGTEVSMRIAERLLADADRIPDGVRLILVPRVNPDAAEVTLTPGMAPQERNLRPVDLDRDGSVDEDGPDDLDGDGVITTMRLARPALPDRATHVIDGDEPRLLRAADPKRGESATHRLLIEGVDADGDGLVGEDPPGGVFLDRNWPHRWPEHRDGAGTHPMSEPETRALAEFVLARQEIGVALTFGRHDNLIHLPDGRGRDVNPRVPLNLVEGDVAMHTELARLYREHTGRSRAAKVDDAGSFHGWIYAQRGRLSLASAAWGRPDRASGERIDATANERTEAAAEDEASDALAGDDAAADPSPRGAAPRNRRAGRGAGSAGGAERGRAASDDLSEEIEWLAYNDDVRNGAGFVDWTTFDHPQFGEVEIGGWIPGFRENPPAVELDDLAERHFEFVVELLDRLPRVDVGRVEVERLADSLWAVRVEVRNPAREGGTLPFGSDHARSNGAGDAIVLRMEVDRERLLGGQRVVRIQHLAGGASELFEWTIAAAEGTTLPLVLRRPGLGEVTISIPCVATGDAR